jgi:hypothetical protein
MRWNQQAAYRVIDQLSDTVGLEAVLAGQLASRGRQQAAEAVIVLNEVALEVRELIEGRRLQCPLLMCSRASALPPCGSDLSSRLSAHLLGSRPEGRRFKEQLDRPRETAGNLPSGQSEALRKLTLCPRLAVIKPVVETHEFAATVGQLDEQLRIDGLQLGSRGPTLAPSGGPDPVVCSESTLQFVLALTTAGPSA